MADRSVDGELVQFQYKLWAVGTEVQVTDYWVDLAYDPAGAPNWTKYQPATAPSDVAGIFKPDAAACFDMMFRYDPTLEVSDGGALVEGRLPPGSKPPYYCLGRCKNPPIVNTK